MGPWNVLPRFSWQHDVKGTTPGPGGNFVEGPLRSDAGRRREPARQVGVGHIVDQVRRRRTVQRPQRPRLRRGDHQVLVLIAAEGNNHVQEISAALPVDAAREWSIGATAPWRPCPRAEAAKLGAELTPLGAREGRQRRRFHPGVGWRHHVRRQAGFAEFQSGRASPGPVRQRQAAVHGDRRRT